MRSLLCFETQSPVASAEFLKAQAQEQHLTFITRTRAAAKAMGVNHQTLHALATERLRAIGLTPAPPLEAWKALRAAIREVTQAPDELGYLRTWRTAIDELLQASPHLTLARPDTSTPPLSDRTQELIQVAQVYQQGLRQRGWVDASEVLWRAAEVPGERRSLLIYGYFQLRADEVAWIQAIAQDPSLLCLPNPNPQTFPQQAQWIEQLQHQGWEISPPPPSEACLGTALGQRFLGQEGGTLADGAIAAHAYPHADAEARGVLAQVKQLLSQGVLARDIVLIARNEAELGPRLLDIAWEYNIPLRALYSMPLAATRVGTWITLWLEMVQQRFAYEATLRFLSHPLTGITDNDVWPAVRKQRPNRFETWQALTQEHLSLSLAKTKLDTSARREDRVEHLRQLFQHFDMRRRAARWAREAVAYNTLENNLVDLAKPEDERLSQREWMEELRISLDLLSTPVQPGRGGVELHTPASVMGGHYRYGFVLNGLEGTLPAPVNNDPVLDFYERRQLQAYGIVLPDAAAEARREAFAFHQLLQTLGDRLTLSYATLEGEPSPYFGQLGISPGACPERAIASLPEARQVYLRRADGLEDAVLPRAIAAFEVEAARESAQPPDEYDGIVGLPFDLSDHWFSVSQLTQLGQCPFKWFAGYGLHLRASEEPDSDLSPSLRGQLYHKVLELALKDAPVAPDSPTASPTAPDEAQLEQWFREAEAALHWPAVPAWESRRIEHIRIVRRAMQSPDFRDPGSAIAWLEGKFEGEWQGLKVWGYVDRIDRTEEGLVLIDYKTSKSAPKGIKDAEGKTTLDLQLPLYEAIAAPFFAPGEPVQRTAYFSILGAKDISPKQQPNDLEAIAQQLKAHLAQGHYPVQPDLQRHACQYCAYDAVCRQGDRLHRKAQAPSQEPDA